MKIKSPSPIVCYGSQILKEQTLDVQQNQKSLMVAHNLCYTLNSLPLAAGLAAPQINSNLAMFAMKTNSHQIMVVINPRIRECKGTVQSTESCLSLPKLSVNVLRSKTIDVEFQDINFKKQEMTLTGFSAILFQHEENHLNGVLHIDHLSHRVLQMLVDKLTDIESGKIQTYYDLIFPDTKKLVKSISNSSVMEPEHKYQTSTVPVYA